jgi:UDP-sugar diphosphatase
MANLKVSDFKIEDLKRTQFVKPVTLTYIQNEKQKQWEAVQSHDSVAVLLYHEDKNSFLMVKQFRAPVYMHHRDYEFTYELCAGIIDKEVSLEQVAKEEIEEECGFDVPLQNIEKMTSFFTNVGISGAKQHLYYASINDSMKVSEGGGIHDEEIELFYLDIKDTQEFIYDESKAKTPGLMFAFEWFLKHKKSQ